MLRSESIVRSWSAISRSLPPFTMRPALISCLMLLICAVGVCYAADNSEEQTKAAKDFKFEGVTFTTSFVEFKKLHPNASQGEMEKEFKMEQYLVPSEAADLFLVNFVEGNLYEMRILYNVEKVSKMGGDDVLIDRLARKFGKADADSPGVTKKVPFEFQLDWKMKEANRRIRLIGKDTYTRIDVLDTVVYNKMLEAKKKAVDTGFDK